MSAMAHFAGDAPPPAEAGEAIFAGTFVEFSVLFFSISYSPTRKSADAAVPKMSAMANFAGPGPKKGVRIAGARLRSGSEFRVLLDLR